MSLSRLLLIFLALVYLFLHTSCDSGQSPVDKVCTLEFRIINIDVLSLEEEPVALDQVNITVKSSGKKIDVCAGGYGCGKDGLAGSQEFGSYTIFHDGLRDKIPGDHMDILVEGSNEQINFQEEFQIGDNGCHVFKAAGPDTVFVEVE